MLEALYTPRFKRDVKALVKNRIDITPLENVVDLIIEDSEAARLELRQRHNMHSLKGAWAGSNECHIANAGDWLVIWKTTAQLAVFERTGSHDELFR